VTSTGYPSLAGAWADDAALAFDYDLAVHERMVAAVVRKRAGVLRRERPRLANSNIPRVKRTPVIYCNRVRRIAVISESNAISEMYHDGFRLICAHGARVGDDLGVNELVCSMPRRCYSAESGRRDECGYAKE